MGPVYTVNVPLQCRRVHLYVNIEFPYYSVFVKILAVSAVCKQGITVMQICVASYYCCSRYRGSKKVHMIGELSPS